MERLGRRGRTVEETVLLQAGGIGLVLWHQDRLADAAGVDRRRDAGFRGVNRAHDVRTREEVDEILRDAAAAGGTGAKEPAETFHGGYAGHFTVPNGRAWEIACNPGFPLREDGTITIPDFNAS